MTGGIEDIDAACFLETHISFSLTCYPNLLNNYADLHLSLHLSHFMLLPYSGTDSFIFFSVYKSLLEWDLLAGPS